MVFSSPIFLCAFLPLVLLLYAVIPARFRNFFLFAASLLFYAWGEPRYILIMLFSTVFDYCNGLALEKLDQKNQLVARRMVLILSVAVNLGLMGFFKYTDFSIESFNQLTHSSVGLLHIALPIGISFYTFQTLSYTIDVYRKRVSAQHNIIDFGMYISMFPQLIAGPIVRYADVETQLKDRRIDMAQVTRGVFRFAVGLCKKVLLANQLGALWDEIRAAGGAVPAATAWLGALAFAFQIYFDFSGYSDMAIGLGAMFGFTFPENFNHPYEANSVTEFWRRWHITLSTWFREYVYIPLGGNRKGKVRQIFNLFVVWFLTGLWHGAGVNFILWGLYFFVFLVLEKLFLLRVLQRIPKLFGHLYALCVVLLSWVIFACDEPALLRCYLRACFGQNGLWNEESLYYAGSYAVLFVIAAILSVSLVPKLLKKLSDRIGRPAAVTAVRGAACLAAVLLCLAFIVGDSYNPFLYFRF